jgi:radical SAM enzyme (TIGR01210 family)
MISRRANASGNVAIDEEIEIFPNGIPRRIGTVYLQNGACPLSCVYCALYRQATSAPATGHEIARQIRSARARFTRVSGIKLYNASSLFEPQSIRQSEYDLKAIAAEVADLDLVVVEARSEQAHRARAFSERIGGRLEVAIGLEVADDALLRLLGKPTTVARFQRAAALLAAAGNFVRAFVLVQPPFVFGEEARRLACSTFALAVASGARVVSLLPVVSEHAPMERLRAEGCFSEVTLEDYYDTVAACVRAGGAVVIAETRSLDRLRGCPACRAARSHALSALNETGVLHGVACADHHPAVPAAVAPGTREPGNPAAPAPNS